MTASTPKEHPILFSAPMVRAILAGTKTQTRRVMRTQPSENWHPEVGIHAYALKNGEPGPDFYGAGDENECFPLPHQPGDLLWVRETWQGTWSFGLSNMHLVYAADGSERACEAPIDYGLPKAAVKPLNWIPSIHMPRWASRITLEVTEVRVQRLQEISEEDCVAEGIEFSELTELDIAEMQISDCRPEEKELARLLGPGRFPAKFEFQMLWDSIYASKHPWSSNPWVRATSFRMVQP